MTDSQEKRIIHYHISAKHKWFDFKFNELWQYRDLIGLFTKRSFTVTYKQTILGPIWLILKPMISSIMNLIVFGNIAKLGTDGIPQILFYFSGTAFWSYFSSSFNSISKTFTSNIHLYGKVYFPRLSIPLSQLLANAINFGIQMIIILIMIVYFLIKGMAPPNWILWLSIPLLLLHTGILAMGCGLLISSVTTKYRDLSFLMSFGVTLWMYATPVVYPLSQLKEGFLKKIICLNPMTAPMELYRFVLLGKGSISLSGLLYSVTFTIVVAILGMICFNRAERNFLDIV